MLNISIPIKNCFNKTKPDLFEKSVIPKKLTFIFQLVKLVVNNSLMKIRIPVSTH